MGVNLCGMEWARTGLRYGSSTMPNLNFTVPRKADVAWLGANGYTKTRLPIQWELLQPMLNDTVANAAARAAIGNPGEFHAGYEAYITGVLDAHAAAGMKCIIDLHNYCRYQDFVFQADGSVLGLVAHPNPLIRAYTTNGSQVQQRIFALAPGATLKQSNYNDFWTRAARKWMSHPGFGGYGLMNEPYNMPDKDQIVESDGYNQDLTIWPTYAQAVINAIRAVDPVNPIYLGGNGWSAAMSLATANPGWPLAGNNIIYEVHMYLDAASNGQNFDYDTEVNKGFSAGLAGPINENTGVDRLNLAIDWAQSKGVRLALTETGMPIDDPRWQLMYQKLLNRAREVNCEVYTWNAGSHWVYRNAGINQVPGWHQNKTLEPAASGPMKTAWGVNSATLFDDGPGWAPSGTAVTLTVYARGNLASPLTVNVASNNGGSFSKTQLTIPAGANGQDTFTFVSPVNTIATLTYTVAGGGIAPPPPRKVYSLADPVAYASTNLADAAMALIAKYSACKWELADGYTDYLQGAPAAAGQVVRAISDSGYGSSPGNAMEMINWTNTDGNMGSMSSPVMRVINGKKNSDHSTYDTFGFGCRKSTPVAGRQPNPKNRVPYNLEENHFTIVAVSVPGTSNSGVVFQASNYDNAQCSEISFNNSRPQAKFVDSAGNTLLLAGQNQLAANKPTVISLTSVAGAQNLRVNAAVEASAATTFSPTGFHQLMLGWGYQNYYPQGGFMGNIYSAITGKGAPSIAEMTVMERYLATTSGLL